MADYNLPPLVRRMIFVRKNPSQGISENWSPRKSRCRAFRDSSSPCVDPIRISASLLPVLSLSHRPQPVFEFGCALPGEVDLVDLDPGPAVAMEPRWNGNGGPPPAIDLKSQQRRGVKFGRKVQETPEQINRARKLFHKGEARQYFADLLNVGRSTLCRALIS
jgi:hypothetical protein